MCMIIMTALFLLLLLRHSCDYCFILNCPIWGYWARLGFIGVPRLLWVGSLRTLDFSRDCYHHH